MSGEFLYHIDNSVRQDTNLRMKMKTVEEMQNKVNLLKDELAKREALMRNLSVS